MFSLARVGVIVTAFVIRAVEIFIILSNYISFEHYLLFNLLLNRIIRFLIFHFEDFSLLG